MYCDSNSRPTELPSVPLIFDGHQAARTGTFSFFPGWIETFFTFTIPKIVSFTTTCTSAYGSVAEYSVGFEKFTRASKSSPHLYVSTILSPSTSGRNRVRSVPTAVTEVKISASSYFAGERYQARTLDRDHATRWNLADHERP